MTFARTFRRGDRVQHVEESLCRGTFVRYSRVAGEAIVDFGGDGGVDSIKVALLRHAPVAIVGALPSAPPKYCPLCGQAVDVSDAIKVTPRRGWPSIKRLVRVVACGFCEFLEEVKR